MNQLPTPCFVIQTRQMDTLLEQMRTALHGRWPQGVIGYSFKTNQLPWLVRYLREKQLFAEVVSSDEFALARREGFPCRRIIFNGPVKGKQEFVEAVSHSAIVNLDARRELAWLRDCPAITGQIGLRVNFDLEALCPGETQCGTEDGRFGFSYECGELRQAIAFLRGHKLPLDGLHLHCSSTTRSLRVYQAIARMAVTLVREFQLPLAYLDIGGGFFGGVEGKPDFAAYFSAIQDILMREPLLRHTNLIVEPGISLVGAAVDYVTSVVDVRQTLHNRFVVLDGSRIHVDPLMHKDSYRWSLLPGRAGPRRLCLKQTLCGFTCMENDRLFQLRQQEELAVGDRIVLHRVGAYTMGLAPLFIQWYPAVYVQQEEGIRCVRKKLSAECLYNE